MPDKQPTSTKRLAIVKSNARNVATVSIASFITIFCFMASKAVFSQNQYLSRVTKAKTAASAQLTKNVAAATQLVQSYKDFVSTPSNVIGGSTQGTGDRDGDNAKIVLDALPSQYDFPALASSLEEILASQNLKGSINGTDDQLAQQDNTASNNPQVINMPFTISVNDVNYSAVQQLVGKLQTSIRPMQIDSIDLTGATTSMTMTLDAHTYYQPGKNLTFSTKVVK